MEMFFFSNNYTGVYYPRFFRAGILKFSIGLVLVIAFISCKNTKKEATVYYNIDSLVNAQIHQLTTLKASLNKTSTLGNQTDTLSITPKDSLFWFTELDVFRPLDAINKPIYQNSYQVDMDGKDPNSNLSIKSYTAKGNLPVQYIKIYYHAPYKMRKLEALYHEENSLYKSERLLVMEFDVIYNKTTLRSYSIRGNQKMFLGDSVSFSITGNVTIH